MPIVAPIVPLAIESGIAGVILVFSSIIQVLGLGDDEADLLAQLETLAEEIASGTGTGTGTKTDYDTLQLCFTNNVPESFGCGCMKIGDLESKMQDLRDCHDDFQSMIHDRLTFDSIPNLCDLLRLAMLESLNGGPALQGVQRNVERTLEDAVFCQVPSFRKPRKKELRMVKVCKTYATDDGRLDPWWLNYDAENCVLCSKNVAESLFFGMFNFAATFGLLLVLMQRLNCAPDVRKTVRPNKTPANPVPPAIQRAELRQAFCDYIAKVMSFSGLKPCPPTCVEYEYVVKRVNVSS